MYVFMYAITLRSIAVCMYVCQQDLKAYVCIYVCMYVCMGVFLSAMSSQKENGNAYVRRKMWLSICQTYDWEPLNDPNSGIYCMYVCIAVMVVVVVRDWYSILCVHVGSIYYMNNVSGTSSWDMPAVLDSIGKTLCMYVCHAAVY